MLEKRQQNTGGESWRAFANKQVMRVVAIDTPSRAHASCRRHGSLLYPFILLLFISIFVEFKKETVITVAMHVAAAA